MKVSGPYVGVTGFMNLNEVVACNRFFKGAAAGLGEYAASRLKFMVGVLVSSKTLNGNDNRWPGRYPRIERVSDILALDEGNILNTVHYNTDDPETIDGQIDSVIERAGPNLHAIQLNMQWVSPIKLQRIRRNHPDLRIILQIGAGALAEVAEPGDIYLGEALRAYASVIDDFLVDPSGGKGEPLDVWHAFACLADHDIPAGIQPGIAGGFDHRNVGRARGLIRRFGRPINLDAEGRLRNPHGDRLVIADAGAYLEAGVHLVGSALLPN